jgi:hypothetical protein
LAMSSSQLTFIFFRGVETTNQVRFDGRSWQHLTFHAEIGNAVKPSSKKTCRRGYLFGGPEGPVH